MYIRIRNRGFIHNVQAAHCCSPCNLLISPNLSPLKNFRPPSPQPQSDTILLPVSLHYRCLIQWAVTSVFLRQFIIQCLQESFMSHTLLSWLKHSTCYEPAFPGLTRLCPLTQITEILPSGIWLGHLVTRTSISLFKVSRKSQSK